MTISYNVSEKFIEGAPAAVHVDGTARPQIVNKKKKKPIQGFIVFLKIIIKLRESP